MRRHKWLLEIGIAVGVAAASFLLAGRLELHEAFSRWSGRYEVWQADELPLALMVLCIGLAVVVYRRWRDTLRLAARNRHLMQQVIELRDAERRRIAHDLHDHFGQTCNAIRVEAACLAEAVADAHSVRAGAERIAGMADDLYDLVRGLLRELRPAALDSVGIEAAIQSLCESWVQRSRIDCRFYPEGRLDGLGEPINMALYRIAQESLSNVVRHAQATQVRITLARESGPPQRVRLRVEDDGRGFPPGASIGGLGLLGMRERAEMVGGRCDVRTGSAGGVMVDCMLPLAAP